MIEYYISPTEIYRLLDWYYSLSNIKIKPKNGQVALLQYKINMEHHPKIQTFTSKELRNKNGY